MSLLIRKAQKDMEESSNYKQFFTAMKAVVPTLEVVTDTNSITSLEGTGKYSGKEEPLPYVMFNILRGYFWQAISIAFKDALKDSMAKEAAADAMSKLTISFVQADDFKKTYKWDLAKVQDKEWTLKIGHNWKGANYSTYFSSFPSAPEIKDQLLKLL